MAHPVLEHLMLLQACDERGRVRGLRVGLAEGGSVPSIAEALGVIRGLEE